MIPIRSILGAVALCAFVYAAFFAESSSPPAEAKPSETETPAEEKARYERAQKALKELQLKFGGRNAELEAIIMTDGYIVSEYLQYLGRPRIPELEAALLKTPRAAAGYLEQRRLEFEPVIARDPFAAAIYATRVLKRPWPEAEPVIFSNGNATAWYADDFEDRLTPEARARMLSDPLGCANFAKHLGKRMPELEPVILRDAEAACEYATSVMKARWPEAEPAIMKYPELAAWYARAVIHGRWPEAEKAICKNFDALNAYLYEVDDAVFLELAPGLFKIPTGDVGRAFATLSEQHDIAPFLPALRKIPGAAANYFKRLNRRDPERKRGMAPAPSAMEAVALAEASRNRIPELEPLIITHGEASVRYARYVLKKRWPEAEVVILTNPKAAEEYVETFIRTPWPEAEELAKSAPGLAAAYARHVLKKRWPAVEPMILESDAAAYYAIHVMRTRWPEAEAGISRDWMHMNEYAQTLMGDGWIEGVLEGVKIGHVPSGLFGKLPSSRHAEVEALIFKCRAIRLVSDYAKEALKSRWPEGERLLLSQPESGLLAAYAREVIQGRWPEAEPLISQNANAAASYVDYWLHARWPEAEPAIFKSAESSSISYAEFANIGRVPALEAALLKDARRSGRAGMLVEYVSKISKVRWPEAEPYVVQDAEAAGKYAECVLAARWPEAEPLILENPESAARYAQEVIVGRWPEAEAVILTDPDAAVNYARGVLRRPWSDAEPVILKAGWQAVRYAVDVLRRRWPELEAQLLSDEGAGFEMLRAYQESLIEGPWPEAEARFAKKPEAAYEYAKRTGRRFPTGEPAILTDAKFAAAYAKEVIGARWPEAEAIILTSAESSSAYATEVIKGRWPEAEKIIATKKHAALAYVEEVSRSRFPEAEAELAGEAYSAIGYAEATGTRFPAGEAVIAQNADASIKYARVVRERFRAGEAVIFKTPAKIIEYAKTLGKRVPEGESIVLTDAAASGDYAAEVINARWPEAEAVIARNQGAIDAYNSRFPGAIVASDEVAASTAWSAFKYAEERKARFPKGEPAILAEKASIIPYAKKIIAGRWPEGEAVLIRDASSAAAYAEEIIGGRWPEAEEIIRTKPAAALRYAKRVLKGRWPEAENIIRGDPYAAAVYAAIVIGDRWPEAEQAILGESSAILVYSLLVINGRWPEAEPMLMSKPGYALNYSLWIRRARWAEIEAEAINSAFGNASYYLKSFVPAKDTEMERLLISRLKNKPRGSGQSDCLWWVVRYVEESRRAPWPEVESYLLSNVETAIAYVRAGFAGKHWPKFEESIRDRLKNPKTRDKALRDIQSYVSALAKGESLPNDMEELFLDEIFAAAENRNDYGLYFGGYDIERVVPNLERRLLDAIAKRPESEEWVCCAASYASYGRKARWPELEPHLLKHPAVACDYRYYLDLSRVPWPELEEKLKNDPIRLNDYRNGLKRAPLPSAATHVLTGPARDKELLNSYPEDAIRHVRDVIKGRWPEFEAKLLAKPAEALEPLWRGRSAASSWSGPPPDSILSSYVQAVGKPCPELEPLIATNARDAVIYPRVLKAEFPKGESAIEKDAKSREEYLNFFMNHGDARIDWRRLFAGGPGNPFRETAVSLIDMHHWSRDDRESYDWLKQDEVRRRW